MAISETQLFFNLIRSAIIGCKLQIQEKELISKELILKMFALSKKHDIAHLVECGFDLNDLLIGDIEDNGKEIIKAVYRYTQQNYTYGQLCDALENAHIVFIPLKGSVIRQYYPEPWMRTSCDIDILVKNSDVERAVEILSNELNFTFSGKSPYDISLFSPSKTHIELHYELVEGGRVNLSTLVLDKVWDTAKLKSTYHYWYEMSDEMFYFYHVTHMAKHFEQGGCGIRPFIDLWILDKIETADNNKRNELLEKGDLMKFAEVARQLSKVWFEDAEHTDITKQMEQYILHGGVYGTSDNRILVQQQKKGGRLKYALSKIFIPYDTIKFHYPVLQKHRWLTPVMEVRRWFKLVFCGHAKRSMRELKQNNNISNAEAENIQVFLKKIGL